MKKYYSIGIWVIILFSLSFLSCKNENKFIGTWIETESSYGIPDTINIKKDGDKIIIYYKSRNLNYIGKYNSKENCLIYQDYRDRNYLNDGPFYKIHYLKNMYSILINNTYYKNININ